jgi:uncharacterized protein YndB with AHSA1/START domain
VIARTFDAPRDLVFKAWTEPERLAQWWGPKGCAIAVSKLELRPGGTFLYSMKMPNGPAMWGKFVYREIVAPERLVFVNSFTDDTGKIIRSPFSPTWPLEILNTLTLLEHQGKTTLDLRGGPINAAEQERKTFEDAFGSLEKGFAGSLDQLADYLARA